MDGLDVRILRAMGVMPYEARESGTDALKPARIAARAGVTPETVRERIQRMERAGVLEGYEVIPNLGHFGLQAAAYLYVPRDEASRARLRDAVRTVEGVLELTYFLNAGVCVDLSFQTAGQRDRRLRALAEVTGDDAPTAFFGWSFPPVARPLTALDWRILRELRHDARRSLVAVAERVGAGYRTVKRHHDRMAEEGSFVVRPVLNPGKDEGLVPAGLLFFFRPGHPPGLPQSILDAFPDEGVFGSVPQSSKVGNFDLVVFARSVAHVEELRQRAARLEGVLRVEALILADVQPCADWLDELIDDEVRRAEAAVSARTVVARRS